MHHGKWQEAGHAVARLAAINKWESKLRYFRIRSGAPGVLGGIPWECQVMHGEDTYCCWLETDPEDQNYCERQMFVRFEVLTVVSVQILTLVVTPCTVLHTLHPRSR